VKRFHPDELKADWAEGAKELSRKLGRDTVRGMRRIMEHVRTHEHGDVQVASEVAVALRETEARLRGEARALARAVAGVIPGTPLTDVGDKVATPLQRARFEEAQP
jgi:hypothetical protein